MDRARHHGMDWLRIGAFALLIVYHVAMVFAPWHWVVKWPVTCDALVVPMALLTPWRLPLLFAVSGFATRRLLARTGPPDGPALRAFVRGRSVRLLAPLLFGMVVLLPPELWVRAREAGYPAPLLHYWLVDYWNPAARAGLGFPQWEHLWFVVYLWTYTLLLVAFLAWRGVAPVQRVAEALVPGTRLLWWPVAGLGAAKLALLFLVPERHGLTSDWAGHAEYVPMFLFGFALGGSDALWRAVRALGWRPLPVAVVTGAIAAWTEHAYPGTNVPPHAVMAAERLAQVAMAWSMVLLLMAAADRWLDRDHRWRARLAEAVFPAYLIHHPVIVCVTWAILPLGLHAWTGFTILLAATFAACIAFYAAARALPWLRPFAGLSPAPRTPAPALRHA